MTSATQHRFGTKPRESASPPVPLLWHKAAAAPLFRQTYTVESAPRVFAGVIEDDDLQPTVGGPHLATR
jgi:hypothetical protein